MIELSRLLLPALLLTTQLATLLPSSAMAQRAPRNGDHIVAVVNTESVTAVEVEQRLARVRADAQRDGARLPADDALRQQVLDALVDERVLVTYARELGQKIDEVELDRAVANVAAQNQLTLPQLRERLKADGLEYGRFRSSIRDQIMVERVREREVATRIRITDADIDTIVEQRRAASNAEQGLSLAQILVTLPEGASEQVLAQRRARAEGALARVRGGEDFANVAREISEDGNRAGGGVIGKRPLSKLPDLFVESTRTLAAGQITPNVVRSAAGFHVLKVLEREEGQAFKVTQTHARHILLRTSERSPAQAVAARLEQVRRQIERGEKRFEDTARELSEDGSAPNGGDLGWASPGGFVPEFEEAMNGLPPGGISPPVASRFGVHLIQVIERRDVALEQKEVREQVRNALREQKFEQAYLDWTRDLRLRAYIEMREPPQ